MRASTDAGEHAHDTRDIHKPTHTHARTNMHAFTHTLSGKPAPDRSQKRLLHDSLEVGTRVYQDLSWGV